MFKLNKQNSKKKKIVLFTTIATSLVVIGLSVGLTICLTRKSPIKYIFGKNASFHTIEELNGKDLEGYKLYVNIDTKGMWNLLPLFDPDDTDNLNFSILTTPIIEGYAEFSTLMIANMEIDDEGGTDSRISFIHFNNDGMKTEEFSLSNFTWLQSALNSALPTWRTISTWKNFIRIQLTGFWKNISSMTFDNKLLNNTYYIYLSK